MPVPVSPLPWPQVAVGPVRWIYWIYAAALTFILHYAWEMLHAPLFEGFGEGAFWSHALPCLKAALGDVLIATAAFGAGAIASGRVAWPFLANWGKPLLVCLGFGLSITVVFEAYALATERWTYTAQMPSLGGIGVTPLLQWIVIPSFTLVLLRSLARRDAS